MPKEQHPTCAKCGKRVCEPRIGAKETPPLAEAPPFCPMKLHSPVLEQVLSEYEKPEVREFARLASIQEFECYERMPAGLRTKIPRIEELIQFAHKCDFKKLGLAFCLGLAREARTLTEILEYQGFEVVSVCCKVGAVPKEKIGLRPDEKIAGPERWESMCNPIAQAEILNAEQVDLGILLGLCVGHDTLFIKYSRVPLTVLAVKDRVTGHNPLAALYLSSSYYRRLLGQTELGG